MLKLSAKTILHKCIMHKSFIYAPIFTNRNNPSTWQEFQFIKLPSTQVPDAAVVFKHIPLRCKWDHFIEYDVFMFYKLMKFKYTYFIHIL